jgi:hypothetical protein
MKLIYTIVLFVFITISLNAQSGYCFDKKFRRIKSPTFAKYIADPPNPNKPSKIVNQSSGTVYAIGVINEADTLSFEGKVEFYNSNRSFNGIRFYKKGIELPYIKINGQLKKQLNGESSYYMVVNDDGEFCAFKKETYYNGFKKDNMIATGKVTDTVTLTMDSTLTIFSSDGEILEISKYEKGVKMPFIATTTGHKRTLRHYKYCLTFGL